MHLHTILILLGLYGLTKAVENDCVISSFESVAAILKACKDEIVLNSFQVPPGKTLEINLQNSATLTINGTIIFGVSEEEWEGPLMKVTGKGITVTGTPGETEYKKDTIGHYNSLDRFTFAWTGYGLLGRNG